jgi:hypothetical protein
MHFLPVGEAPGWSQSFWIRSEVSRANIWSTATTVHNLKTMKTLTYETDYEQVAYVLAVGKSLTDWLAFEVEAPFVDRDGGAMDGLIDNFHVNIGVDRFRRNINPPNKRVFRVETAGQSTIDSLQTSGVGHLRFKLKFWPLRWPGSEKSASPYGLGASVQYKQPVDNASGGLTSGSPDTSALLHLGLPLWGDGSLILTSGYTWLGPNPVFKDWPRHEVIQTHDILADLALGGGWGFVFGVRMESPFMSDTDLKFVHPNVESTDGRYDRMISAYNALVQWRTFETLAIRKRFGDGQEWQVYAIEDLGAGDKDAMGDASFVHNAPDFQAGLRVQFGW